MTFAVKMLVPKSEYDKLKHTEEKYNALLKKSEFKDGSGDSHATDAEQQAILIRQSENELHTPTLGILPDPPIDNPQNIVNFPPTEKSEKSVILSSGQGSSLDAIAKIPTRLKSRANRLLKELINSQSISWNSIGEIKIDGKVISHSNIQDLLRAAFVGFRRQKLEGEVKFFSYLEKQRLSNLVLTIDISKNPVCEWYKVYM